MRYVFYILTLSLVFTAGMIAGSVYIPAHTASASAAISIPQLDNTNPALDKTTLENAQQALDMLAQGLAACPMVVDQEKDFLFNRISLYLALQDFLVKKAVYEAEIAKNIEGTPTTAQFTRAAADYSAAKLRTEQLADQLFPQLPAQTPALPAAISTTTASVTVLPSTSPATN
ncbi:MAG: hypothetical protein J6U96_05310 [Elusimicrobiaceae bacterium]|nr:hypothetical protein [Elusimicrobiaceae bacterium]